MAAAGVEHVDVVAGRAQRHELRVAAAAQHQLELLVGADAPHLVGKRQHQQAVVGGREVAGLDVGVAGGCTFQRWLDGVAVIVALDLPGEPLGAAAGPQRHDPAVEHLVLDEVERAVGRDGQRARQRVVDHLIDPPVGADRHDLQAVVVGDEDRAVPGRGQRTELLDRGYGAGGDLPGPVAHQAPAVRVRGEERPVVAGGDAGGGRHRIETVGFLQTVAGYLEHLTPARGDPDPVPAGGDVDRLGEIVVLDHGVEAADIRRRSHRRRRRSSRRR